MSDSSKPLRATVNTGIGEGFSLYTMGDDENLAKTIHLGNVACGFHASDFTIMDKTVTLAKANNVFVGAHPSLPDLQGFGRREMILDPADLTSCCIYQVGALDGFLKRHGLPLHHIKPHGALYGQTVRNIELARALVGVAKFFNDRAARPDVGITFVGLAGTAHQKACEELGVHFIAEWFADLEYDDEGELILTKCLDADDRKYDPVSLEQRVKNLLELCAITTVSGKLLPIGQNIREVSVCVHSDQPGAADVARIAKELVDESNKAAGYV